MGNNIIEKTENDPFGEPVTSGDFGIVNLGIETVTVNGVRANNDTAVGAGTANWNKGLTLQVGMNDIVVAAYDNCSPPNVTTKTITLYHYSFNPGILLPLLSEE